MAVQLPSQLQPIAMGAGAWDRAWYEWAWRLTQAVNSSGGGGGAPTNASYVVLGLDAGLTAERVLTAGSGISITDGGAGGPVTIACTVSPGVPTSRQINTTAPLTGGGALSADLTLGVDLFTDVDDGIVPASGGGTVNFLRADGTWAAPASGGGGAYGTAYVDFGATPGTRLTATVVDAAVTPSSVVVVTWGDVQLTDDNDPELDPITFFATPGSGQFTVTAVNDTTFSGSCRIAYTVG